MPKYQDLETGEILTQEQFDAIPENGRLFQSQIKEEPKRLSFLQQPKEWLGGQVGEIGEMVGNIPSSGRRFLSDIKTAITHPVETIKGLGQVGAGGIQSIPGIRGLYEKRAEQTEKTPQLEANKQAFQNVKNFFVDRYGGWENIQKTMREDPVGVAVDLSTIASGGVGLFSKTPRFTMASKALGAIEKATEPITATGKALVATGKLPAKAIGVLGRESLGVSTGTGGETIRTAFGSAKAGSREFIQAKRGLISQQDVLVHAKEGLNKLKQERGAEYSSQLSRLKEANKVLDFNPIKEKITNTLDKFNITINKNKTLNFNKSAIADTAEQLRIEKLMQEALKWQDDSVIGLDILKRRLADFNTTSREGLALKTSVKNSVKDLISKEVPEYKKMISDYETKSLLIDELQSTMSLKEGVTIDTVLTKLSSALRRDHTFRRELLQKLDDATKQDIAGQIAGSLLNPVVPSGLIGRSIFAGGPVAAILSGTFAPTLFTSLLFASPRIVAEFLTALGIGSRYAENIIKFLNRIKAGEIGRTTTRSLFQAGRLRRISQ